MGVVASELRAIEALDAELEEDPLYFSNVLKWGYDPSERTPYRDVQRLEAGCAYWFEGPRLRSKIKYFDLEPAPLDIREELETAVRHRMIADVPVASLCSGGLDSTIVTLLAARSTQQKLTVFHVDNDEEEWVDQIDWPANVDLRKIELHPTLLQDAVAATEEPVDLGSVLPQYQLGQAVRDKGFHVCLSGDGADELFGGYGRAKIYDSQYSDVFCELVHYHLPRLDKTMMASTVELRSPFLAPRVVRAALAVPYSLRTSKESLKAAFSDIVPPSILQREKYPLKTRAAREGGMEYRKKIVDIYRRIRFDRNG
jgi:asparagine synthetase B (glutamine-hydrolysing)